MPDQNSQNPDQSSLQGAQVLGGLVSQGLTQPATQPPIGYKQNVAYSSETAGVDVPPLPNQQLPQPPLSQHPAIPVVTEEAFAGVEARQNIPTTETINPKEQQAAPPSGGHSRGFSVPIKYLVIGIVGLVVLGAIGFAAKTLFLDKKEPQVITLTYWGLEEPSAINSLIREYEAKNSHVKVQYQQQAPDDYRERLVNNLAKSVGPDIFSFHNTWVPMLAGQLDKAPIAEFNSENFAKEFYPVAVQDLVRESAVLGIPLFIDGLGMYVNETIFNETGKLVPNNWNDLKQTALEMTQKDEEGRILRSGVALGRTENVDHWEDILSLMLLQNRADLNNPQGVLAADPVLFYISFSKEDKVWDETLPASTEAFAKGLAAMYFGPSWRAQEIKQLNPNLSFRVVPVPQLPKNATADLDINYASYQAVGVWGKSKNATEAWKFLKFASQDSSLEKLYASLAAVRGYGNPYPRPSMAQALENDPLAGAYVRQGGTAKSSYLASGTHDGAGINTKLAVIWKGLVDALVQEQGVVETLLPKAAAEMQQVLAAYSGL